MSQASVSPGWRPTLGLFFFIFVLVSPLLVPLVLVATALPSEASVSLAGLLLFGLPLALMLAVVTLVGQPAFLFLRRRIAKRGVAPSPVSVIRYRIELALLTIPIIVSWLVPLVSVHVPEIAARRTFIGASADGVLLLSLFVLGGNFWAKVRAFFVRDARCRRHPRGRRSGCESRTGAAWLALLSGRCCGVRSGSSRMAARSRRFLLRMEHRSDRKTFRSRICR